MSEHNVPSAIIPFLRVAELLVLFPAAVLQLHARASAVGDEPHFHVRHYVPTWRAPGEGHEARRLIRGHPPDVIFGPVDIAFVEASADASFHTQICQVLAAEGRSLRPPLPEFLTEPFEGNLWRTLDLDRLTDSHSVSPFSSTCRLKASRARSQNWLTSWRCSISSVMAWSPVGASS